MIAKSANIVTTYRTNACMQISIISIGFAILAACTPRVEVLAPEKPIEINLNIKIEQELRITLEKDVDALLDESEGLY